jgi:hypothetical protein
MQNERHLSLRGSEDAAQKHRQSLRAMAESLGMARETAHTLSMQSGPSHASTLPVATSH